MKRILSFLALSSAIVLLGAAPAQERGEPCHQLNTQDALNFLPHRVPLEMLTIPVDTSACSALRFADQSRIVIAPLDTRGLDPAIQNRYHFIIVSETRFYLGDYQLPAGMVGLGWKDPEDPETPVRVLVARDFMGAELSGIRLSLVDDAPERVVDLRPAGEKEFVLQIGRHTVAGRRR